jgi:hypothetical protein
MHECSKLKGEGSFENDQVDLIQQITGELEF